MRLGWHLAFRPSVFDTHYLGTSARALECANPIVSNISNDSLQESPLGLTVVVLERFMESQKCLLREIERLVLRETERARVVPDYSGEVAVISGCESRLFRMGDFPYQSGRGDVLGGTVATRSHASGLLASAIRARVISSSFFFSVIRPNQ